MIYVRCALLAFAFLCGCSGYTSASSNAAEVPGAPGGVQASPGNAQATVQWQPPASKGGTAIERNTVRSAPGSVSVVVDGGVTTATVPGLANGTSYVFTVFATNTAGDGPASAPSAAVTPRTIPGPPQSVTAIPGDGQATVSWAAPASDGGSAITGYTVTSSGGGTVTVDGTATSAIFGGLTNGTAYTFIVFASNAAGAGSASAPSAAIVPRGVPGAPTGVTATAGNAQASVSWTAPASNGGSAITGYTVTSSPGGLTASVIGATSATVAGLTNGTAYTFTVTASNVVGTGPASAPSAPVTPRNVPGAPTGVAAVPGNGQATVSWIAPADTGGSPITGYTVTSSPGGFTASTTGATSAIVAGLTNGTAYTFTVVATNAVGPGNPSVPSTAVIPRTVPGAPTGVGATAGNAQALVTWTAPVSDGGSAITGYTVTSSPPTTPVNVAAVTTATVSGLINGTSYTFTVIATNLAGNSAPSAASAPVTPLGPPGPPTAVAATPGNTQAVVNWTAPASNGGSAITGYTVTSNPPTTPVSVGAVTTATVAGLANGTPYTFTVVATNAVGNSAPSTSSAAVTPAAPPGAPTGVTATPGNAQAIVNWTAPVSNGGSGIVSYTIVATPSAPAVQTPGTTGTVPGLTNGTSYTFTVAAANPVSMGPFSQPSAPVTPTASAFPIRPSIDGRTLVDVNGTPFPILGRTSWFVMSLSAADQQLFLNDTAGKGYDAIEFHVIDHDPRGNKPPFANAGTLLPFLKRLDGTTWTGDLPANPGTRAPDFTTPNEAYWVFVDQFLVACESKGILVFMFPAYTGFNGGDQGWMQEMSANGEARMQTFGAFVATRYRNQRNIVWMIGGDKGAYPNNNDLAAERGLIAGLKSVAGQSTMYSAEWDSESICTDQFNFGSNCTLNGAYSFGGNVNTQAQRGYGARPVLPTYLLEEPYDEEGPDGVNFNPTFATQPVRRFQWWGWLSGIGGYISGNGFVWPFNAGGVTPPLWQQHLNTQGAKDMARLNAFIVSIPWWKLVPSGLSGTKTLITAGQAALSDASYVAAAAIPDGTLVIAYVPPAHSGTITVDMTALRAPARARWFNPTTALFTDIGASLPNTGTRVFTPPGNNGTTFTDWALVIDAP